MHGHPRLRRRCRPSRLLFFFPFLKKRQTDRQAQRELTTRRRSQATSKRRDRGFGRYEEGVSTQAAEGRVPWRESTSPRESEREVLFSLSPSYASRSGSVAPFLSFFVLSLCRNAELSSLLSFASPSVGVRCLCPVFFGSWIADCSLLFFRPRLSCLSLGFLSACAALPRALPP